MDMTLTETEKLQYSFFSDETIEKETESCIPLFLYIVWMRFRIFLFMFSDSGKLLNKLKSPTDG